MPKNKKFKIEFGRTERGFKRGEFIDDYGSKCSIQESSIADRDAIWLGINDANPEIMASIAPNHGVPTNGETTGWVPYPIPRDVHLSTRMHLTRKQVAALIPVLQLFVDTGELPKPGMDF